MEDSGPLTVEGFEDAGAAEEPQEDEEGEEAVEGLEEGRRW